MYHTIQHVLLDLFLDLDRLHCRPTYTPDPNYLLSQLHSPPTVGRKVDKTKWKPLSL